LGLLDLKQRYGGQMVVRVSIDHYGKDLHELERGRNSWKPTVEGMDWLAANGFSVRVAGRTCWNESAPDARAGYGRLFAERGWPIDAWDERSLVMFPEMDPTVDVPEITESCWGILNKSADGMMCASSRMVIKRKGAVSPAVVACTLLPYDRQFELGTTLAEAAGSVSLNHPHCAKFCVLGGGSCSKA
jgi:hypothetical protein